MNSFTTVLLLRFLVRNSFVFRFWKIIIVNGNSRKVTCRRERSLVMKRWIYVIRLLRLFLIVFLVTRIIGDGVMIRVCRRFVPLNTVLKLVPSKKKWRVRYRRIIIGR